MEELAKRPYEEIKGMKVRVKIGQTGQGNLVGVSRRFERYYKGEILDASPNQLPWRSFLVKPLSETPWAESKWVKSGNVMAEI